MLQHLPEAEPDNNPASSEFDPPLRIRDANRRLLQFFEAGDNTKSRIENGIILAYTKPLDVKDGIQKREEKFSPYFSSERLKEVLSGFYNRVEHVIPNFSHWKWENITVDEVKKSIALQFAKTFTLEAAAACNPSIVEAPNQEGLKRGELRVIVSNRSIGENHCSSVGFDEGIVAANGKLSLIPLKPGTQIETGRITDNTVYNTKIFFEKLTSLTDAKFAKLIVNEEGLGKSETFTCGDLRKRIEAVKGDSAHILSTLAGSRHFLTLKDSMHTLLQPGYEITFEPTRQETAEGKKVPPLSSRVLFPQAGFEIRGIEDARFVAFKEGKDTTYHATVTAFDGDKITPQMVSTKDFLTFKFNELHGKAAQGKGMALFPRKIDGQYVMIGRQDGMHMTIMRSSDLHHWDINKESDTPGEKVCNSTCTTLQNALDANNVTAGGNCGSPIETKDGWLVITHGIGYGREYTLGAMLLDINNPTKILAELKTPLVYASGADRKGYVPDVVYSCGSIEHNGNLILPYAFADTEYKARSVSVERLLERLHADQRSRDAEKARIHARLNALSFEPGSSTLLPKQGPERK